MNDCRPHLALAIACLLFSPTVATAANWPEHPTLTAVRAAQSPAIDGDLSDAAWQAAPVFTDFTQNNPDDGQPATLPTTLRIVYDDEAIYFGMKMTDPAPPTAQLARRDTFTQSDFVSINIDPQLDRLSGSAFTVNPMNVQVDTILYNDIDEDGSWDGVWSSASKIVEDGWITEVRVPYSQLRFPDKPSHVWGLNITRRTVRLNEWVRIVNTRKGETGFVSHFADIVGLEGIRRGRPLELVPYAVVRSDVRTRTNRNDPLIDRRATRIDGGLDLKYALTPSLTLTGTVNPDFGQVEVDPAVVNLSQFETFYPEKRPFFTEGSNLFRFGDTPAPSHFNFTFAPSLFYTRRIGRTPQVRPVADYVTAPSETTILGAAKITGKLPGGWSIGVLDALTDTERGRFVDIDEENGNRVESGRRHVEPMTNYFVSRLTKDLGSDARLGMMFTSVNRKLADELTSLRENAFTGGIDGFMRFGDKSWILEGSAMGSRVTGSARAIELTQRSPSRYYQRPDAAHVTFDPARTSLSGFGGRAMLSKATGKWRPNVQVQAYSPGYETNDTGFMQRTDMIASHAVVQYVNDDTTPQFRRRTLWFGSWQNANFDGDTIERGFFADGRVTLENYHEVSANLFVMPGSFSDRLTRGGPVVRTASSWSSDAYFSSDTRKKVSFEVSTSLSRSDDDSYRRRLSVEVTARPSSNMQLSVEPRFTRSQDTTHFLTSSLDPNASATYGRRYLFSHLDQRVFELRTRADWTLSSRLSLQLYLQPFVAAGDYHSYRTLVAPRTRDYASYDGAVPSRDFNFRSIRGSAVARWEFRPGSALYVVWNENRADVASVGDFRFGRDLSAIPNAPSHDVVLVKVSYWLPM